MTETTAPSAVEHHVRGRVHVLPESGTAELGAQLAYEPEVNTVTACLDRLSERVLASVERQFAVRGTRSLVPVVILRGGLLMFDASRRTLGTGPWGFLLPATRGRGEPVAIQRIDVPQPTPGATYLLIDPIVNSGQTIRAALAKLESVGVATAEESVALACIFLTGRGEALIRQRYPTLEIFAAWNQLAVDDNGWVAGVGFDAGDLAVGGTSRPRLIS